VSVADGAASAGASSESSRNTRTRVIVFLQRGVVALENKENRRRLHTDARRTVNFMKNVSFHLYAGGMKSSHITRPTMKAATFLRIRFMTSMRVLFFISLFFILQPDVSSPFRP
jgi:hypothetical protein